MTIGNTIKTSLRNILKNKTRSLLTALGIIIGVASVIVMVGVGTGSQQKVENSIASIGTNLITVSPASQRAGGGVSQGAGTNTRLSLDDVARLKKDATYLEAVSPNVVANAQVIAGNSNWRTQIYGVAPEFTLIRNYNVAAGAFFTDADVVSSRSVAVLGQTVVDSLFADGVALGKQVRINLVPFTVIGVLESKGTGGFGNQDDDVFVPYTTAMNKLTGSTVLRSISASAVSSAVISQAQDQITALLREQHRLSPGMADDFTVGTQTDVLAQFNSAADAMTLLLGAIAAVSLVVGGIGIMNIMLVSVKERTREIGIRMAVGAKARNILLQFLIEAFVLSMLGGLIGVLLSLGIELFLNAFTTLTVLIEWNIVLLAFVFSGSVGIFFGLYPAKKASELNPIDALRYE